MILSKLSTHSRKVNPAKLAMNGTIHAKQINVDLNVAAPDYVFQKNYKLRSLPEISRYITFNKI